MSAPQAGLGFACPGLTRAPGVHPQRQQIWRRQLPAKVKLEEDVDITALALKFELSGGYIRNALQAALIRRVLLKCSVSAVTVQHILSNALIHSRRALQTATHIMHQQLCRHGVSRGFWHVHAQVDGAG